MDKVHFSESFSIELTPDEATAVYAFLQEAPAKFSRSVLNKLDAVSRAQLATAPTPPGEKVDER